MNLEYINLLISSVCGAVSLTTLLHILIGRTTEPEGSRYLSIIALTNMLMSLAYIVEFCFAGRPGYLSHNILWLCAYMEFLPPVIMLISLNSYLICRIEQEGLWVSGQVIMKFIYGLGLILVTYFSVTGRYFYIDTDNRYHRGDYFDICQYFALILIVLILGILVAYRKHVEMELKLVISLYLLFPILAVIYQFFYFGLYILEIAMTISIITMAIYYERRQLKKLSDSITQLENAKIAMFLSQMRPHFLYNALSSISQLCKRDPEKASEMTDYFAEFLRKNMADIQKYNLIPFEKELHHLRNYIAIEQMRFGEDGVRMAYHLETTDFYIPGFVLQPLVENAIKHGIIQKEEGGMISISTREEKNYIILTIADDGVGFDINRIRKDGKLHLGVASARERLHNSLNARLLIDSTPGVGTTVTICIPKG